jgi:metal-responsive CopG/Arc/MetJ family transcriptional regulator
MKKGFLAVRVELPEELYKRFQNQTKKNYKSISSVIRDYIVQYTTEGEEKHE